MYSTIIWRQYAQYWNPAHHCGFITYPSSDQIECVKERAMRTNYNPTIVMPYIFAFSYADLESLKHR